MNYRVYTCTLTQPSDSDPVVVVLENQLCGTVEWTRNAQGNFFGSLVGAFPIGKTHFLNNTDAINGPTHVRCGREDDDRVSLASMDADGQSQDGLLNNTLVEIRIYY